MAGRARRSRHHRDAVPSGRERGDAWLDGVELQNLERRWMHSVRSGASFEGTYHVRSGHGSGARVPGARRSRAERGRRSAQLGRHRDGGTGEPTDDEVPFLSDVAEVSLVIAGPLAVTGRLVQVAVEHFCEACAIDLLDDDGTVRADASAAGPRDGSQEREQAFLRLLEGKQGPLVEVMRRAARSGAVGGATDTASQKDAERFLRATEGRSMMIVPLSIGASRVGAISFLELRRAEAFESRDVELGFVVARQLATALENIKSFEREQKTTERFRFLARATARLFVTLDRKAMLAHLLQALVDDFADWAVAAALADDGLWAISSSHAQDAGSPPLDRLGRLRELATEGELATAALEGRPYLMNEVSKSSGDVDPRALDDGPALHRRQALWGDHLPFE